MARQLSPLFKLAFFTLLIVGLLFVAGAAVYSYFVPNPTKSQSSTEANLYQVGYYFFTALGSLLLGKIA